jgi:uncharacterized DUF497 family protein
VEITYDPVKNARNVAERGISFDRAADFDFDSAVFLIDHRRDRDEVRYRGFGNAGWTPARARAHGNLERNSSH